MKKLCLIVFAVFVVVVFSGVSSASDGYPTGPVRAFVPTEPGGASDLLVRTLAPHLGRELGVTVVVENHPGAGNQIGNMALLAAPADGYTIALVQQPHTGFTIAIQDAPYKLSDFAFLNMHQIDPISMVVLPGKPWNNLQDLIDDIKANPGTIAIGATQMSGGHLFLRYLQEEYDLRFRWVPYSAGGEGRAAVIGGHIDAWMGSAFSDFTMRDQLRCIFVGSPERSTLWPDVPTVLEATGNQRLADVASSLSAFRAIAVSREFKENHPERFEKLLEAYYRAFHSEEHMADAERTGMTAIMAWVGHEEAERLAAAASDTVERFAYLFQ